MSYSKCRNLPIAGAVPVLLSCKCKDSIYHKDVIQPARDLAGYFFVSPKKNLCTLLYVY